MNVMDMSLKCCFDICPRDMHYIKVLFIVEQSCGQCTHTHTHTRIVRRYVTLNVWIGYIIVLMKVLLGHLMVN